MYKEKTKEYLEIIKGQFVDFSDKTKRSRIELPYIELLLTRSKLNKNDLNEQFVIEFNNIINNIYLDCLKRQHKNKVKLKFIVESFDLKIKNI